MNLPALSSGQWFVDYAATEINLSVILGADFDQSGMVDSGDFFILQRNFGLTGQTDNSNGDANGNGIVDANDLQIWEALFGTDSSLGSTLSTVPEPSGLVLLLVGSLVLTRNRGLMALR